MTTIRVPPELEDRLRHALQQAPAKKKSRNRAVTWVVSAAAAFLIIAGAYQFPAFAYYGGKLLDRSELTSLSFAEVAEQGYGQPVNKSTTLEDGTVITVNGVIADDNALLIYYSIDRPEGSMLYDDGTFRYSVDHLQGLLTDLQPHSGSGNFSEDRKHYEGVDKFDPVSPFARKLTVTFGERLDNGEKATYSISFKFEANKAMKSLIQQDISKAVTVDQGKVHYDSITATPTSTIVKGHFEMDNGENPRFIGDTKLYVNGAEVKSWGAITDGGLEFELEFDVFPTDQINSIKLVLQNFDGYEKVTEPISLSSPSDHSIIVNNEKLWIRSVEPTGTGYDVVIATKQFTSLEKDHLSVQAGGKTIPVSAISSLRPWDLMNGNILWERTYSFTTTERPEALLLDGFYYIKTYDQAISVDIR